MEKECTEKMELMKSVLTEKDSSGDSIQNQLNETIERNAADVKKQIELFKSQTEIKKTEEKELLTVLKDYRKKY
jgi:5S rRNA maturation endonuclease (ribonuclease M5)